MALSTAYWPQVLPPPRHVTARIDTGASATLTLPIRSGGGDIAMPEPEDADPLPKYREIEPGRVSREVARDLNRGTTEYRVLDDSGLHEVPETGGLQVREIRREVYAIAPSDPLSACSETHWTILRRRGEWAIRTESRQRLTADATTFELEASIEAFEGSARVFERTYSKRIRRDHM